MAKKFKLDEKLYWHMDQAATTGIEFTLYTDFNYDNFYVDLETLIDSTIEYLKMRQFSAPGIENKISNALDNIYYATADDVDGEKHFTAVDVKDVKKLFATFDFWDLNDAEIFPPIFFEITEQPIPRRAFKINKPRVIYSVDHNDFSLNIFQDVRTFLFDYEKFPPVADRNRFISTACRRPLYTDGEKFYCEFNDVRLLLKFTYENVGSKRGLEYQIAYQVLMEQSTDGELSVDLNCKLFDTVMSPLGEFKIYKGVGFGENAFFFKSQNLAELIDVDINGNVFNATLDDVGYLYDEEQFNRLDHAAYIVRHYLARLWNGENQQNDSIQRGWTFIRWFENFLPPFLQDNVKYFLNYPDAKDVIQNFEEPTKESTPGRAVEMTEKELVDKISGFIGADRNDVIDALLALNEKSFLARQENFKKACGYIEKE